MIILIKSNLSVLTTTNKLYIYLYIISNVFFQIGTNDGNDNFRNLVKQKNAHIIILVEPNTSLISKINKNYENIKNVFIYNKAIYYKNDETIELFIPSKNKIMGVRADNGIVYDNKHFSMLPMNDWAKKKI